MCIRDRHNTDKVIKRIPGKKKPEHHLFQMRHLHQKEPGHQRQRQKKHHIAKDAQLFFSWLLRLIVGQKVQHHSCPAGVAAPATPKKQRSENLCNRVVDSCCFENAEKQVVPEPFDEGLNSLSIESSINKVPVIINDIDGLNETLPQNYPLKVKNNCIDAVSYTHLDVYKRQG